jgi:hypothetical protein
MDACRIARARDALGGGVRSTRIALRAAVFQSVTTSHDQLIAISPLATVSTGSE